MCKSRRGPADFLVCLPVYEKGKPVKTAADRRTYLMGFILGVFRPIDMLNAALAPLKPEGIDVGLFDASAPATGRYNDFHASRTRDDGWKPVDLGRLHDSDVKHFDVRLDVAGHPWTVACLPTPRFVADRRTYWPWGVLATGLAFTAMLAAYLWLSINQQEYLEHKVHEQTVDIRRANEEIIDRLVSAAQWSDEETGMHIRRTGLLSEVLARAAGWFGDDVEALRQAAPMHDIGKIGIPDAILQKPGKLTPEEFAVMKTHTRIGADILSGSKSPMLQMAREIALNHHERWDGKGYPQRAGRQGHSRVRSHRRHRRRLRRPLARPRLSAGAARIRSPDDHAAGGGDPFRPPVDDVLLPALRRNPPHRPGTPRRQLDRQAGFRLGRQRSGHQGRDFPAGRDRRRYDG